MNTDILRKAVVPSITGVAGLSVGVVLGIFVERRRGKRKAEEAMDRMIDDMRRESMELVNDPDSYLAPSAPGRDFRTPVEKLHDITKEGAKFPYYKIAGTVGEVEATNDSLVVDGVSITEEELEEVEALGQSIPQNAFNHPYSVDDDKWDWEKELQERSNKPIYVITAEEFRQGELGYRQGSIIFYEGDRMMTDELGEPIYNWTSHVGTELPFGHGTGDENILFVRNESLKWEYEIQRDPGSYDIEVKGHDIQVAYEEDDLRHMHRPLKMRRE